MSPSEPLDIICLCAEWCTNCRAYRATFHQVEAEWAAQARFRWLDVEDESEVMGEVDIEDFPSLLVLRGAQALFLGPITPQPQVLSQLVQSGIDARLQPLRDEKAQALAQRIRRAGD